MTDGDLLTTTVALVTARTNGDDQVATELVTHLLTSGPEAMLALADAVRRVTILGARMADVDPDDLWQRFATLTALAVELAGPEGGDR